MSKNGFILGSRKLIAIVLIINLVTIAAGQEIQSQAEDSVSEDSSSTVLSPVETDRGVGLPKNIESGAGDNPKNEPIYRQPSIGNRGVSAVSKTYSQPIDTIAKRKLLPPPIIPPDTADNSQTDSLVAKPYRVGKTEKRILLITGAILVTGGLVLLLAKSIGKEDKTTEDTGIPEPPRPPMY